MRRFRVLALLATAALACVPGFTGTAGLAQEIPALGAAVPDLAFTRLDGRAVRLAEVRRGADGASAPVVLTFWSFHCPTGAASMDRFAELARACRERGVAMLGVCAYGETAREISAFARDHGIDYPLALDTGGAASALGARVVTATYVLDWNGRLVYRGGLGDAANPYPERALDDIAAGLTVAVPETPPRG